MPWSRNASIRPAKPIELSQASKPVPPRRWWKLIAELRRACRCMAYRLQRAQIMVANWRRLYRDGAAAVGCTGADERVRQKSPRRSLACQGLRLGRWVGEIGITA